jgi:NAD(P)-dependent dehydrogenase (short-subunit alcohol dehydrogenase family)
MSAMIIHLGLDRPTKIPKPKDEKVLIWGGSSSVGFYAIQIAAQAGYKVMTTASPANFLRLKSAGAAEVFDYHSSNILSDLISLGPYRAIFAAAESATDQVIIGKILEVQGGGKFLSTMGARPGVVLPTGVEAFFVQYMDDYFKPELEEFKNWFFEEWQEQSLINKSIQLGNVEILGNLNSLQEGLSRLEAGDVRSSIKLVIRPN